MKQRTRIFVPVMILLGLGCVAAAGCSKDADTAPDGSKSAPGTAKGASGTGAAKSEMMTPTKANPTN